MIRTYVYVEGTAQAVVLICTAFWCGLVVDWFFEPPLWTRGVLLVGFVFCLLSVIIKRIFSRLRVPLSDANIAVLLERRFTRLDDTLLTAVDLSGDIPLETEGFSSSMLQQTCREAEKRLESLSLGEVIRREPLRRLLAVAGVLAVSVVLFALLASNAMGVWVRRSLLFYDEPWPRQASLSIEGFTNGVKKVARGSDVEVVVKADCTRPLVPKTIEIRYRSEGGSRHRTVMTREGDAQASGEPEQRYTHTFRGVLAPIELDIRGGDVLLEGLKLIVVESPTVEELSLECEYPSYMNRPPRTVPVISTVTEIPFGTRITVHGRAAKDLREVTVDASASGKQMEQTFIKIDSKQPNQYREFEHDLGVVREDMSITFNLLDTDDIKSCEPVSLSFAVAPDLPPELSVRLRGIGTAVTPTAHLPVEGQVSDDHGIAKLWFEYAIDKASPTKAKPDKVELFEPDGNPTQIDLNPEEAALELGTLDAEAGQKLLVAICAADRFDLVDGPNRGSSQRWLLDIVTPAQLEAMLQARELVLRQRFEAIIEEVTETRDSLERIDFSDTEGENADRGLAIRTLRCERAIQNGRKNAHEVLGTAEAFDHIRLQLVNNRIDTEELRVRLEAGIAKPLKRIAEIMFPQLELHLQELHGALDDMKTGPSKRDIAKKQIDAILLNMDEVLSRMMELEDYGQAIAILRSIIESQKKLGTQVKQQHKAKLRELLED
ncbi:MAG: hypothetical protein JXM70_08960 [Pirellulales bacterium]|nr:hypothetical protein [Pirellulales bacterium]